MSPPKTNVESMRVCLFLLLCVVAAAFSGAATIEETFASDPATHGWRSNGETSLFHWNSADGKLAVTWDSSKSNSFFCHPLGTILAKTEDCSLAFDLRLTDIAIGVNSNKQSAFELAVGFINLADATQTHFLRGVGINPITGPRNLIEFDYFPDSGFGATISPTIVSSNNQFAVGFDFPLELTPGDLFRITMTFTASNQTLVTVMTRNSQPFGPVKDVKLGTSFSDFRLDAVAVCSYSDAGADGSILAHGMVDNLVVTVPDPPISSLAGIFTSDTRRVEFTGQTNWLYTLERTEDFRSWTAVSPVTTGVEGRTTLSDVTTPTMRGFYRVRAERR